MMKRYVVKCVVGSVVTLAILIGVANAKNLNETPRVVVTYGDLDLSQPESVDRLYRRLANAAERVCSAFDSKGLERRAMFSHCKRVAMDDAVKRVAIAALSSRYAEQSLWQ